MKFDPLKVAVEVAELDRADQGGYFMAILRLWAEGPLTQEYVLKKYGQAVFNMMTPKGDRWSFAWLEEARAESEAFQSSQSAKGKKSAAAKQRKNHGSTTVQPRINHEDEDEEVHEDEEREIDAPKAKKPPAFPWDKRKEVIDHLTQALGRKPDNTHDDNDFYASRLLGRMKEAYPADDPIQKTKDLITYGLQTFLSHKVTSMRAMFYDHGKIIEAIKRGITEGKIKVQQSQPTEERHFYEGYGPENA